MSCEFETRPGLVVIGNADAFLGLCGRQWCWNCGHGLSRPFMGLYATELIAGISLLV